MSTHGGSGGGGGSGTVTSVAAADTSVVIGGTPTVAPTVRTNTLDVIATDHAPAADWSNNSHKITSLANGSGAQDAAAFGQIAAALASYLALAGGTMSGVIAMGTSKITGLGNGTAAQDAAAFGQLVGRLLANVQYAPASATTYSTTSSTLAAIDTTNLTIPFTVPLSGNVIVRLQGLAAQSTAGSGNGYWGLEDHTSHAQVGVSALAMSTVVGANGAYVRVTYDQLITGLTPGASLQYDWAWLTSAATFYLVVQGATGQPGNANGGPGLMQVWGA